MSVLYPPTLFLAKRTQLDRFTIASVWQTEKVTPTCCRNIRRDLYWSIVNACGCLSLTFCGCGLVLVRKRVFLPATKATFRVKCHLSFAWALVLHFESIFSFSWNPSTVPLSHWNGSPYLWPLHCRPHFHFVYCLKFLLWFFTFIIVKFHFFASLYSENAMSRLYFT